MKIEKKKNGQKIHLFYSSQFSICVATFDRVTCCFVQSFIEFSTMFHPPPIVDTLPLPVSVEQRLHRLFNSSENFHLSFSILQYLKEFVEDRN